MGVLFHKIDKPAAEREAVQSIANPLPWESDGQSAMNALRVKACGDDRKLELAHRKDPKRRFEVVRVFDSPKVVNQVSSLHIEVINREGLKMQPMFTAKDDADYLPFWR